MPARFASSPKPPIPSLPLTKDTPARTHLGGKVRREPLGYPSRRCWTAEQFARRVRNRRVDVPAWRRVGGKAPPSLWDVSPTQARVESFKFGQAIGAVRASSIADAACWHVFLLPGHFVRFRSNTAAIPAAVKNRLTIWESLKASGVPLGVRRGAAAIAGRKALTHRRLQRSYELKPAAQMPPSYLACPSIAHGVMRG